MPKTSLPKILGSAILFTLLLSGAGCLYAEKQPPTGGVACSMEAKLCPDGSAVGRSGPKCEFAPCPPSNMPAPQPVPTPAPTPVPKDGACSGENDNSCGQGYRCVQDCGPPVARVDDPAPGWHCLTEAAAAKPRMCPICLASNTMIDTPSGSVSVTLVRTGTVVWSVDRSGKKIPSEVLRASRTPVPVTHKVVHLVMADGREVWVSPAHPTADGRRLADLRSGDTYDGGTVASTTVVPYWDTATYDILPAGDTGFYWANGVLLGSTLSGHE
jgi:hypothetical protein